MFSRESAAKLLADMYKPWKTNPRTGSIGEGSIEIIWIQVLDTWTSSLDSFTFPWIELPGNVFGDDVDHSMTMHKHISLDFNAVCKY